MYCSNGIYLVSLHSGTLRYNKPRRISASVRNSTTNVLIPLHSRGKIVGELNPKKRKESETGRQGDGHRFLGWTIYRNYFGKRKTIIRMCYESLMPWLKDDIRKKHSNSKKMKILLYHENTRV